MSEALCLSTAADVLRPQACTRKDAFSELTQFSEWGPARRTFKWVKAFPVSAFPRAPHSHRPILSIHQFMNNSSWILCISVWSYLSQLTGASNLSLPVHTCLSLDFELVYYLATLALWWVQKKLGTLQFVICCCYKGKNDILSSSLQWNRNHKPIYIKKKKNLSLLNLSKFILKTCILLSYTTYTVSLTFNHAFLILFLLLL